MLQAAAKRRRVRFGNSKALHEHGLDLFKRKLHDLTYDNVAVCILQDSACIAIGNNGNVAVNGARMSLNLLGLDALSSSSPGTRRCPSIDSTSAPIPKPSLRKPSPAKRQSNPLLTREDMINWLSDSRFTHALTLNFNRVDCSLRTARKLFGIFCRDVDRMMLGRRRVERLHTCERFEAIAFPEHLESNLHLHVVANFARRYWGGRSITEEQLAELAPIWRRVTRGSGTSEIKLARDAGWARYVTKEMHRPGHEYILSADFHSDRYVVLSLPALDDLTS
ncbi:hypothetical protein ACX40Y_09550 [Sphingomonas sp. RS6]